MHACMHVRRFSLDRGVHAMVYNHTRGIISCTSLLPPEPHVEFNQAISCAACAAYSCTRHTATRAGSSRWRSVGRGVATRAGLSEASGGVQIFNVADERSERSRARSAAAAALFGRARRSDRSRG
eukprot:365682-Chlamydomonas_euryale.AAC.10